MGEKSELTRWLSNNALTVYVFSFLIPLYPKFYGLGVLLIGIEVIARKLVLRQSRSVYRERNWTVNIALIVFYLMYVVGLTYTENMSFASLDLGMKVSFLLFPLLFLILPVHLSWKKFALFFIAGAVVSIVINFALSAITYFDDGFVSNFFDSHLSHLMHRSYWATYLVMAYSFTWWLLLKNRLNWILGSVLLLLMSLFTFMSGSKMGILILAVVTAIWIIHIIIAKRAYLLGLVSLLLLLILGWTVYTYSPQLKSRIIAGVEAFSGGKEIDPTSTESNTARILVWSSAIDEIKEHFFFGVGTGDIKDKLNARNIENGYTGVAELNLNSHNQFLNTHLAIGIIGSTALLIAFISSFLYWRRLTNFAMMLTVLILFLSLLPEAFFETQAGIVPGAFLLSLQGLPYARRKEEH